jgi:hypothetical protein
MMYPRKEAGARYRMLSRGFVNAISGVFTVVIKCPIITKRTARQYVTFDKRTEQRYYDHR